MNYLLDTHAFLWALFDEKKLSESVTKVVNYTEKHIYVSVITIWEISLKYSLGKLNLGSVTPDILPGKAEDTGFEILGLSAADVSTFYRLPIAGHRDPFDRLIIWQAINNELTLISKDTSFNEYAQAGLKCFW